MVKIDPNFNTVGIIFQDEINMSKFYLTVYNGNEIREDVVLSKINFISNYKLEEREYIEKVFNKNYKEKYFTSKDGKYNLFVPFDNNATKIIFLFNNRNDYGTLSK